jgi:hypothetical protein
MSRPTPNPRPPCPECRSPLFGFTEKNDTIREYDGGKHIDIPCRFPVKLCPDCGYEEWGVTTAFAQHNALCRHLERATLEDIDILRSRVEQANTNYASWEKIATVIIGCSENTLHRWRRMDGKPSRSCSIAILDAIRHDCGDILIRERIRRHENPSSVLEETTVGIDATGYPHFELSDDAMAERREHAFDLRLVA